MSWSRRRSAPSAAWNRSRLRENTNLRQQVATQLSAVGATLDGLMVDRPRRNLLRRRSEVA